MIVSALIKEFFKKHPVLLGSSTVFMALEPLYDIVIPHLYGKVIDTMQKKTFNTAILVKLCTTLAVVLFGYQALDAYNSILIPKFQSHVRSKIVSVIIDKHEQSQSDLHVGQILSKMIAVPPILIDWFTNIKDYGIPYFLVFLGAVVYFLKQDIILGIFLALSIGLLVFLMLYTPSQCKQMSQKSAHLEHEINDNIEDVLRNILSVYESDQKQEELSRLHKFEDKYCKGYRNTMLCILRYKFFAVPGIIAFVIVFIIRCNLLIKQNRMQVSTFISLFIMVISMIGNISWMVDIIRDITFNSGIIAEVDAFLSEPVPTSKYQDLSRPRPIPPTPPFENGIGLYDVTYQHPGADKAILNNFSIHFYKGQRTGITGEIGSGKTTIVRLLVRMTSPDAGDLYVDGTWYKTLTVKQSRSRVRYIPQTPALMNRSILENILYGNQITTENEVISLMKNIGIYEDFAKHDGGLHASVGKNGSKLSGGQRQLIWCLRALLRKPRYLVLDEPTASMDEGTKKLLKRLLDFYAAETTVIIITHDKFVLDFVDRVVQLENGVIITDSLDNNQRYNKDTTFCY